MKKYIIAAALLTSGTAAYAASPSTVSDMLASCNAALAACCEAPELLRLAP